MKIMATVLCILPIVASAQDFNSSIGYGQLRCQQSYRSPSNFNRNDQPELELYGEVTDNGFNDSATVGFKFVIPLGKKQPRLTAPPIDRCSWARNDARAAARLDRQDQGIQLEKGLLEIEQMRLKLERDRAAFEARQGQTVPVPVEEAAEPVFNDW